MNTHITVLRNEAIEALAIKPGDTIVDATVGSGGHTAAILERLGEGGTYVGIDADVTAISNAEARFKNVPPKTNWCTGNFRNIDSILNALNIKHADGILADLGWRLEQFQGGGKGFSFQYDEPLTMTYGDSSTYPFNAQDIVNEWEEKDIYNVLTAYGEERFAYRIAKAILAEREEKPILTSGALTKIIEDAVPPFYRRGKIHPATRTFQALRVAVNDEFEALEVFLHAAFNRLSPGGRLAIISFHSLEDRIVKTIFRALAHDAHGYLVTKKPLAPTPEEIANNPRARSAKLRIIQKYEPQENN